MSAATINQMYNLIQKDKVYEEVLNKFFSNKNERDEFRQFLWLMFSEKASKFIDIFNQGHFKWTYINIIKKQVKSNESDWHRNYREYEYIFKDLDEFNFLYGECDPEFEFKKEKKEEDNFYIDQINEAIAYYKRKNLPDIIFIEDMLKEHYINKKSFRTISKESKESGGIYITRETASKYTQLGVILIKKYIKDQNK